MSLCCFKARWSSVNLYRLWIAMSVALSFHASACPVRPPDGLTGTNVGEGIVTNGLAMSIVQVESPTSPNEVLTRAEKAWAGAGFKVKRNHAAGWDIVSALSDQCLATLQLANRKTSFGYFSRSKSAPTAGAMDSMKDAPIPQGVKVTSSVASDDGGRRGLTLSMTSAQPIGDLLGFFMKYLNENHWQGIRSTAHAPSLPGVPSVLIGAQRNRQQIQIMMWSATETQIVMTVGDAL